MERMPFAESLPGMNWLLEGLVGKAELLGTRKDGERA